MSLITPNGKILFNFEEVEKYNQNFYNNFFRKKKTMKKQWTTAEDMRLMDLYNRDDYTIQDIANAMNRSYDSVSSRRGALGLNSRRNKKMIDKNANTQKSLDKFIYGNGGLITPPQKFGAGDSIKSGKSLVNKPWNDKKLNDKPRVFPLSRTDENSKKAIMSLIKDPRISPETIVDLNKQLISGPKSTSKFSGKRLEYERLINAIDGSILTYAFVETSFSAYDITIYLRALSNAGIIWIEELEDKDFSSDGTTPVFSGQKISHSLVKRDLLKLYNETYDGDGPQTDIEDFYLERKYVSNHYEYTPTFPTDSLNDYVCKNGCRYGNDPDDCSCGDMCDCECHENDIFGF